MSSPPPGHEWCTKDVLVLLGVYLIWTPPAGNARPGAEALALEASQVGLLGDLIPQIQKNQCPQDLKAEMFLQLEGYFQASLDAVLS